MKSVCCKARPYEMTDLDDLSGICEKCRKPTIFEKEEEIVPPQYEGYVGMWDMFINDLLGIGDE